MPNSHKEKYVSKLLIGICFITAGVLLMFFVNLTRHHDDWYFWGILSAVAFNTGILLVGSAFVHKIKADLIRRQKQKEQQKTFTSD
jgi:uncharacterized membrane protein HdeD (DUF308 family)